MPAKYIVNDDTLELAKIIALLSDSTIDNAINGLVNNLQEIIPEESSVKEILRTTGKKISSGEFNSDYLTDEFYHMRYTEKKIEPKIQIAQQLAFIYTYSAMQLKEHSIIKSWQAISMAKGYIWYCHGIRDPAIHAPIERARKGGIGKSQKRKDLKQIVIEHLRTTKPEKGWRSVNAATDAIIDTVMEALKNQGNRFSKNRNDLIFEIRNMINEDREINAVYASPKNKKTL